MQIIVGISLDRIRKNLLELGGDVILMVKADAYAHGISEVAKATEDIVMGFGVATVDEGVKLRNECICKEILVAECLPDEVAIACQYHLTLGVGSIGLLKAIADCESRPRIHLKLNTGMNRFGFDDQLDSALRTARDKNLQIDGVYSHFYSDNDAQLRVFEEMADRVQIAYPNAVRHVCSSSTIHRRVGGIARVGLSAYVGAMTVSSRVVAVREIKRGERIGYGDSFSLNDKKVAWVFGGYADCISREHPQSVRIRGKICPPIAVCMDTFAVDVSGIDAQVGDEVVLQDDGLNEFDVAEQANTIPYCIMTSRRGRIERVYYD